MLAWFLFNLFYGERVQLNNGLGGDGATYAIWAQTDPFKLLNSKTIGIYHATRILPSIIIHYVAHLFDYPLGDFAHPEGVVNAFVVFNSALIMGSTILLYLIARHFCWRPPVLMLGFVTVFVNFPILKLSIYNPTLTDVSAFFFGLLTFYVFLKDRQLLLFMVSVLAAFVWPTALYTALPLLVFQCKKRNLQLNVPSLHSNLISTLISAGLVAGTLYVYYAIGLRLPHWATPVNEHLILLSALFFFAYVWLSLRPFVDLTFFDQPCFLLISWRGVVLSVILVATVKLAIASYSSKILGGPTAFLYIQYLGLCIIVKPLINVVAHVSYFGPAFILLLLLWKDVVAIAKQYGPGIIFVLIITALMSIGTESRNLVMVWPILAILMCEALNRRGVTWHFVYSILAIGLLTSRFWLPINTKEPWMGSYQDFPYQMFFMNFGPWISDTMYVVFLAFTLIIFIALLFAVRKMDEGER